MYRTYILKESAQGISQISMDDMLLQDREIFLTDEVNAETANEIMKQVMVWEKLDHTKEIVLYINSPGGEVQSGLALYDVLTFLKSPVRTVCTGCAASMGAILFLAGEKRQMLPHSSVMLHDPAYAVGNISGQKPHEIQSQVDKLMETREIIAKIIAEKTGKTMEEIYQVTREDSYFNAKEAVEFGLATEFLDRLPLYAA